MVCIDKSCLIGKGRHRECYRHPEIENLCVKVRVAGNAKESNREKRYYRHLARRGISWDMIPAYHGDIETNFGIASVFDLILDRDGTVSKTLKYYLFSEEITGAYFTSLSKSLLLLKDYLLQQRIITITLLPKNIVCQKDHAEITRLFVVDNIGDSALVPICTYSEYFARKKILKMWERFKSYMVRAHKHNRVLHAMLTRSDYVARC